VCIAKIKSRFPYSLKLFGSFVGICVLRVRWEEEGEGEGGGGEGIGRRW